MLRSQAFHVVTQFGMVTQNPQDDRLAQRIGSAKSLSACMLESGFVNHSALAFESVQKSVRHRPCGEGAAFRGLQAQGQGLGNRHARTSD
jgi:hypothetical protein